MPPSRLNAGVDFHLFKEGIEPKWEDPRCSQGGKWVVQVQKSNKGQLDTMWLNTVWHSIYIYMCVCVICALLNVLPPYTSTDSVPFCFRVRILFVCVVVVPQLLAMIGEQFEDGNEICGAVVSVRQKQDRIAIWTRTATNEETQIHIGKKLKEFVDVGDNVKVGYLVHEDAKQMDRRAKDRYTV